MSLLSADVTVTSSKISFHCIWVNSVLYNNFNKFKFLVSNFGKIFAATNTLTVHFT